MAVTSTLVRRQKPRKTLWAVGPQLWGGGVWVVEGWVWVVSMYGWLVGSVCIWGEGGLGRRCVEGGAEAWKCVFLSLIIDPFSYLTLLASCPCVVYLFCLLLVLFVWFGLVLLACLPRPDDFADGVCPGGLALDLNGENPEQQNLDAGA
jgi:hypothetical protein